MSDKKTNAIQPMRRVMLLAALVALVSPAEAARRGCGSRGGPGYRKANGKCASRR